MQLGAPDDVDILIELKDWLFALEGEEEMAERWRYSSEHAGREERCWHTTFQNMLVKAKSSPKHVMNDERKLHGKQKYPVELITVIVCFITFYECNRSYQCLTRSPFIEEAIVLQMPGANLVDDPCNLCSVVVSQFCGIFWPCFC